MNINKQWKEFCNFKCTGNKRGIILPHQGHIKLNLKNYYLLVKPGKIKLGK